MDSNLGKSESLFRMVGGAALGLVACFLVPGRFFAIEWLLYFIAAYLFVTGMIRWCPLYSSVDAPHQKEIHSGNRDLERLTGKDITRAVNERTVEEDHSLDSLKKEMLEDVVQEEKEIEREIKEMDEIKAEPKKKKIVRKAAKKAPSQPVKKAAKKAVVKRAVKKVAKASSKPDDLTKIEGVGPAIQKQLASAKIKTYTQLAQATPKAIKEELSKNPRLRMHDPKTWPRQAKLAASGKWKELEKLQDKLNGGR